MDQAVGKRAGARRAEKKRRELPIGLVLLLSVAVTLCLVAWGYLVKAAIDFGIAARGGEEAALGFLALACAGAAACLFTGLILGSRLVRTLGLSRPRPRPGGGRRIAR